MATVDIPEDQPIEVTVGAPTFVTGVGGIDGITEARAAELDALTLAAAKVYADEIDTVPVEYVDDGDADAVAQAKTYTDTALVEATANAESYTDDAIAGIDFPDTGVPEATIDAKDQVILTQAKAHADAKPTPDVTKAYVDTGLSTKAPIGHTHDAASLVGLNASLIGLGNVNNTSDAGKPVSTAQATALGLKANTTDVRVFTPSGAFGSVTTATWSKPAGARFIEIRAVGAGGGGGAGGVGALNTAVSGGGGGGGGNIAIHTIPADLLPASVTVQVGRGGAGGNPGASIAPGRGGTTRFGSFTYNEGWNGTNGVAGSAGNGGAGQWGAFATASAPNGASAPVAGTAGVSGNGSSNNLVQTTGGGSGAGITSANATSPGGTWGPTYAIGSSPSGAGAAGGGRGTDGVTYFGSDYGTGGGGGGSSATSNGGDGGHGAPGGGGGGGGAARTGFLGGIGGNGGDGRVTVTTYF